MSKLRAGLLNISRRYICTSRLPRPISVAPMVDITTPSFLELLNIISGKDRYNYYTEMYHCQAILHHADHLDRFVGTPRSNVVVQLGGSNPDDMARAAKILEEYGYSEVNLNVGCPSQNVQSGMFGAILMKTPHVVADILSAMEKNNVRIPVTVKCRIGVDRQDNFEFLHTFVSTILSANRNMPHLIVHARKCLLKGLSPKQNRTIPPLNYDRVFEISKAFPHLPISINGGFTEPTQIEGALNQVDGCMVGRRVMDDPLFLQQLDQSIYQQNNIKSSEQIIDDYLCYTDKLLSLKLGGNDYGLPPFTMLVKPLTMLYSGKMGRNYRRVINLKLKQNNSSSPEAFRSVVLDAINECKQILE